jgi:hypothetical protein
VKTIRGKYLVRIGTNEKEEKKIIICGTFDPVDFDIDEINDSDEMWVSDLIVIDGGIKFTGRCKGALSPEDFLEGECQLTSSWECRENL